MRRSWVDLQGCMYFYSPGTDHIMICLPWSVLTTSWIFYSSAPSMAISKSVTLNSKMCWRSQTYCAFPQLAMSRYIIEAEKSFVAPICILQGVLLATLCRPLVHPWIRMEEGLFFFHWTVVSEQRIVLSMHTKLLCRMGGIRLCSSLLIWTHL